MSAQRQHGPAMLRQKGLTYIEVLVAMALIAVALVPALEALQTGILGARIVLTESEEHYRAMARMEEALAEQHGSLVAGAADAGSPFTPSNFSDTPGTPMRRLVFLGLYDADDADGDSDVFTVPDPDLDGDNNPFTSYTGLVWVRVEIEGSAAGLESLAAP